MTNLIAQTIPNACEFVTHQIVAGRQPDAVSLGLIAGSEFPALCAVYDVRREYPQVLAEDQAVLAALLAWNNALKAVGI